MYAFILMFIEKDLLHGFRVTNRKTIYNEITIDYVNIVHGEAVWTF